MKIRYVVMLSIIVFSGGLLVFAPKLSMPFLFFGMFMSLSFNEAKKVKLEAKRLCFLLCFILALLNLVLMVLNAVALLNIFTEVITFLLLNVLWLVIFYGWFMPKYRHKNGVDPKS